MKTFYNITPTNHGWGYGYGFFSNYRVCLEQLMNHINNNGEGIPYINWDRTTWIEGFNPFESENILNSYNPFDLWFDQDIPKKDDIVIQSKDFGQPFTNNHRPYLIDHSKHYFDEPEELLKQQTIDRLYIKPKQYIINKIDEIYEKEFKDYVVLGVMARGTEYNLHHPMYGVFDVNDYILKIRKILSDNPQINKLFIVSEDSEYVNSIHAEFPSSYFMSNVFRRTDETMEYVNRVHCWPNVSTKRLDHCKLLGEETIIQTKLLGKCDYLFGRLSGVLTGAILWNENIKELFKI
jgi:hypothetical protein